MDPNGVVNLRIHRRTLSSDRFLNVFSPPKSSDIITGAGDELNEDDVFWTGDFSEPNHRSISSSPIAGELNRNRHFFRKPENSGILAALSEDNRKSNQPLLYRKPSIASSSRIIPAPQEREFSQSVPARKYQQSAPMNVRLMPRKVRNNALAEVDLDVDEEEEMLPPHEIVARGSSNWPTTTFSVLEGVGRTLKGRDLRLVRNAVWRKTGFLD